MGVQPMKNAWLFQEMSQDGSKEEGRPWDQGSGGIPINMGKEKYGAGGKKGDEPPSISSRGGSPGHPLPAVMEEEQPGCE